MFMTALSVMEPWASLIIHAGKRVENRTWYCGYRGDLVICASKRIEPGWDQEEWGYFCSKHSSTISLPANMKDFVLPGHALGLVAVIGCDAKDTRDEWEAPGQYHIRLTNVRPFKRPFLVRGQLGLFQVNVPPTATEVER